MHRWLTWNLPGIEGGLTTLRDDLVREAPELSTGDAVKFRRWVREIETVLTKAAVISGTIQPEVEAEIGYSLGDREQFVIAMFRPSTRNLFDEIAEHARGNNWCTLTDAKLRELAGLHEVAGALAWIGDAALKIGLLPAIWDPDVAKAGVLTRNRKAYDRNSNLARLCDRWRLYEHRIHFDADTSRSARKINHTKGTLVESVFGILFLKEGLKGVASAAKLLKPPPPVPSTTVS
ncbi:MAG: ribonuclease III domain-containing protein [Methanoculleus horonobensis]|nr:ribonuclease III domain-containing protein [Methanoculleus horonobensis]MDD4251706.1 ribonuclease III domain-containing protein [Methanoculleus horonobensis]